MDIREYLQTKEKGFYRILCNSMTVERRKQFYDAVNNWHESELKLLNIHSVVGQSEQLADHQCKFYVNADWTKLKCECGKEQLPEG